MTKGGLLSSASELAARLPAVTLIGGGLVAAAGALTAYSYFVEPFWLEVTHPSVTLPGLPREFDGFVIAQLSDFHLLPRTSGREAIYGAIDECNRAKPDVVVLTGDYVVGRRALQRLAPVLDRLTTRPAFAVLGNHDYRFGRKHRPALVKVFDDLGITILENTVSCVARGSGRLWFIGVGDAHTSHDRFGDALQGLGEADRPRILLTHYPDLLLEIPPGSVDLALAGHTHGAQVRLPYLTDLVLRGSETRFSSGFFQVGGVPMYVNRGLGTSTYRFRFRARPELTLLTLRGPTAPG